MRYDISSSQNFYIRYQKSGSQNTYFSLFLFIINFISCSRFFYSGIQLSQLLCRHLFRHSDLTFFENPFPCLFADFRRLFTPKSNIL